MFKLSKIFFSLYLGSLLLLSVFFLYKIHLVGNNWTVSEWLINYTGGFTRRGFGGEILIYFSELTKLHLRKSFFIMQSFFYSFFFICFFFYIKSIKTNFLLIISLLSPAFLLYPLAELEGLGRKEIILFVSFLLYIIFCSRIFSNLWSNFFLLIIFPLNILIYEPIIFFYPFIIFIFILKNKILLKIKNIFFLAYLIPTILFLYLIVINEPTHFGHLKMCLDLKTKFNEECYGALSLLISKSSIYDQFKANVPYYNLKNISIYFTMFLLSFGPIFFLISSFSLNNIFFDKKINGIYIFLILLSFFPIFLLSMMDWGRAIHMAYTFTILTFLFLLKEKFFLKNYSKKFEKLNFIFAKKKIFRLSFIFFYCFTWNFKVLMTESFGSFPIIRIMNRFLKYIS